MKCIRLGRLLALLISFLLCASAIGGQETHGGNGAILEFVKIGQNIKSLLESHPEWEVSQIVSPRKLAWSINNTFVNAGDSPIAGVPDLNAYPSHHKVIFDSDQLDAYDSDGNIYIHLALWNKLDCNRKIIEVFHLYLMQFNYGTPPSEKFDDSSYNISSLFPEDLTHKEWCSGFSSEEFLQKTLALNNLSLSEQVKMLRNDIVKFVENSPTGLVREVTKLVAFKAALKSAGRTQVIPKSRNSSLWLRDKDVITSSSDFDHQLEEERLFIKLLPEQSFKTRQREIRLASNMSKLPFTPSGISIWIDEKRWATFTYGQKFELIFHEYLSLFTTLDLYYRVSSSLFLGQQTTK